jgi:hypothetical protein
MSKVLRRPMFRGGSTNMNGIMSGIKDRENYQAGSPYGQRITQTYEDIQPALQEIMGTYQKPTGLSDPVTQFLIQGGLDLMTRPSSGNILRDIAQTGKATSPQLFEAIRQQELQKSGLERDIKSAGLGLAGDIIKSEIAAEGRAAKMDPIEALKFETEFKRYSELGLPANVTERAANFVVKESDDVISQIGSKRYGGILDFNVSDRKEYEANKSRLVDLGKENKIVYDPFENNYKRITIVNGQPQFDEAKSVAELMQIPLPTAEPREEIDRSLPDFGMSIEDPIA